MSDTGTKKEHKVSLDFSRSDIVEGVGFDLGLRQTYAYHCIRCNYLWFPKDFDPANRLETKHFYFVGQNIFELEPPKVCARCKSRYWRKYPSRKTDRIVPDRIDPSDAGTHRMILIPRLKALHRSGKLDFVVPYCRCKYCKAIKIKNRA